MLPNYFERWMYGMANNKRWYQNGAKAWVPIANANRSGAT